MSLFAASIASGSNGNCYFIGNEQEAILIDVGISCREIEIRMTRLGLDMAIVKAIFITHEHTDHVRGLATLAKKYNLPVFCTLGTWNAISASIPATQAYRLTADKPVHVGSLKVMPFAKCHDAAEPISMVVSSEGMEVGVFTDIGRICEDVIRYFSTCDAVFLECNYEAELLQNGRYPYFLKRRIQGGQGHLSNAQALELFANHRKPGLKLVFPSHLSRDNNSTALVTQYFQNYLGLDQEEVQVVVATRECETPLFCLSREQPSAHQETLKIRRFDLDYQVFL